MRGILRRKHEWRGPTHDQKAIDRTERCLLALEGELAKVERVLRESREAETHSHTLPDGYQGTAAQIARRLDEQRERFGWLPDRDDPDSPFPLDRAEAAFLAEMHARLDQETLAELCLEVGTVQLPESDRFKEFVATSSTAEESAARATGTAVPEKVEALGQRSSASLDELRSALMALKNLAAKATRVLGHLAETVVADLLVGSVERWSRLASEAEALLSEANALLNRLGTTSVELPSEVPPDRLRADARQRLTHFRHGGGRGFGIFAPRIVKETAYIEKSCLVDGRRPDDIERLASLVTYLDLVRNIHGFERLWPDALPELTSWKQAVALDQDMTKELRVLLQFFDSKHAASIAAWQPGEKTSLSLPDERNEWIGAVDDKQNSPEAIGVPEDSIARLAREHLKQFRFRDEFRPDTSLFDHAERSFENPITLREHFRCVPEIIRFSNDLCYRDASLIPLRQAPPNRLPAMESRFVAEGACEGKGARILNRAEAAAVVEEIEKVINDKCYQGKSFGVIALQGNAQSHLIEQELAKRLDLETMDKHRLRCGGPAAFQGDERDVIFLSLVVVPNIRHRALTTLPDQRRFNVAMSRARDQVRLLYSVRQHDLGPDDLRRKLIAFFENPVQGEGAFGPQFEDLDRLERDARSRRLLGNQPEPYESWFEVDVALELLRRGFAVRPQAEVAGYRIDLVVEGNDARLAVECDGDAWHGAERYEHDMARQRQLERSGGRGQLPTRGSHRSGRAQFGHPAPRRMASLLRRTQFHYLAGLRRDQTRAIGVTACLGGRASR